MKFPPKSETNDDKKFSTSTLQHPDPIFPASSAPSLLHAEQNRNTRITKREIDTKLVALSHGGYEPALLPDVVLIKEN